MAMAVVVEDRKTRGGAEGKKRDSLSLGTPRPFVWSLSIFLYPSLTCVSLTLAPTNIKPGLLFFI